MKSRLSVACLLAVLTAVSGVALDGQQPAQPQDQPPVVFRVDVEFVEVDAIVTDENGNPVTDLTVDDFEVLEDGQPQAIETFSMVDLPVEAAPQPLFAEAPIEPDVQDNIGAEGRIYLFVLDDLHTEAEYAPRVRDAARLFVEQYFGANDLGAVAYISGRADDAQDFTRSKRLLLAAIDRFTSRKPTSLLPMDERERAANGRTMMRSLRRQAEFMAGVRGRRKAMLLFSEGVDFNVFTTAPSVGIRGIESPPPDTALLTATSAMLLDESRNAVAAATRGNVVVYAIDARGLVSASAGQAATADGVLAPIALGSENPPPPEGVAPGLRRLQLAQNSLRALAADTGGFAVVNRNTFDQVFDRIVRENSTYYIMGYYPANERRDGRFRRVEVRVRRPGLQVRARSGYIEPRGRPADAPAPAAADPLRAAIDEAVASPLPVAGLPVRVFAAPFKGTAPNAAVAMAIELDTRGLQFAERDGVLTTRLQVQFVATDTDADIRGSDAHAANMTFPPEALEAARGGGFRFLSQIDLPPGRYQLRVGAGSEGGQTGSVIYDLEIPDFYRAPLAMSGVAIASQGASRVPTARPRDPLGDYLPGAPTAARQFGRGDTLALFTEFYENLRNAPPHTFDITTTLTADGGTVVFEHRDERSSTELQGGVGGYGYTVEIPLGDVAPGTYVLRVEGRSRAGNAPAVSRDILIEIL